MKAFQNWADLSTVAMRVEQNKLIWKIELCKKKKYQDAVVTGELPINEMLWQIHPFWNLETSESAVQMVSSSCWTGLTSFYYSHCAGFSGTPNAKVIESKASHPDFPGRSAWEDKVCSCEKVPSKMCWKFQKVGNVGMPVCNLCWAKLKWTQYKRSQICHNWQCERGKATPNLCSSCLNTDWSVCRACRAKT